MRQKIIRGWIANFYCHKVKLIIDLDGDYNFTEENIKKIKYREKTLKDLGYELIRFKNEMVIKNIEEVVFEIKTIIDRRNEKANS